MPEKVKEKEVTAPDPLAVISDALKAAGFVRADVRISAGVHDTVLTVTLPKGE